ncbi:MAG: hypothetical protein R6V46_02400 [Desulfatiglandaceae bacterium]
MNKERDNKENPVHRDRMIENHSNSGLAQMPYLNQLAIFLIQPVSVAGRDHPALKP